MSRIYRSSWIYILLNANSDFGPSSWMFLEWFPTTRKVLKAEYSTPRAFINYQSSKSCFTGRKKKKERMNKRCMLFGNRIKLSPEKNSELSQNNLTFTSEWFTFEDLFFFDFDLWLGSEDWTTVTLEHVLIVFLRRRHVIK